MTLNYARFPGCCGSAVIYGFVNDAYILAKDDYSKTQAEEQTKRMKNFFRESVQDRSMGGGFCLSKVGFVHAVLNQFQLLNEPLLLEYGFVKTYVTVNKNTHNKIHHYVRVGNQPQPRKPRMKKARLLFSNITTPIVTEEMISS